jgi:hypothetical protein
MSAQLAMSVATGVDWLGFRTKRTKVLLIDTELHKCDLRFRLREVKNSMGVTMENLCCNNLRGAGVTLDRLESYFEKIRNDGYGLIIIDALFKLLDKGTEENDNTSMTHFYNQLGRWSMMANSATIVVHHASKGNQAEKSVIDVGSGAGSMARSADVHMVLRAHQEKNCFVAEARVRSFRSPEPMGLRFNYPVWVLDDSLDVELLEGKARVREERVTEDKAPPSIQQVLDVVFGMTDASICRADGKDRFTRKGFDLKHFNHVWDQAYSARQIKQTSKAVKDGHPALYSRVFVTQ